MRTTTTPTQGDDRRTPLLGEPGERDTSIHPATDAANRDIAAEHVKPDYTGRPRVEPKLMLSDTAAVRAFVNDVEARLRELELPPGKLDLLEGDTMPDAAFRAWAISVDDRLKTLQHRHTGIDSPSNPQAKIDPKDLRMWMRTLSLRLRMMGVPLD